MSKCIVFLVGMILSLAFPFLSEDVEAGLGESSMWETIDCDLDATESPTTLLSYDGLLYIGTYDSAAVPDASIWYWDGTECTKLGDTGDYMVYSSVEFDDYAMWGTRASLGTTQGSLFYYDGTTYAEVPELQWWGGVGGSWIQSMFVNDTSYLFISGSDTDGEVYGNGGFARYCTRRVPTRPCNGIGMWTDTTLNKLVVGQQDDMVSLQAYDGFMFSGGYDAARIFRYYDNNQTWWPEVNNTDGNYAQDGQGIYYLLNYSNECLHYGTYKYGVNGTLCTQEGTWYTAGNLTQNAKITRGYEFNDVIYHGVRDENNREMISTFDNDTEQFHQVFTDLGAQHFNYFAEFESELYVSRLTDVYVRRESAPRITIKSPSNNQVIYGDWRLVAKVETDKSVLNVKFVLAEYDVSYDAIWDSKIGIYYHEHMDTKQFSNGVYHLRARLNHTDGSYSIDNISIEINHDLHNDITILPDGSLRYTYQVPWVPPIDWINGPDYVEGVKYMDPYYIWTYEVTEVSSSPSAAHTSYNPYDISENDVEILSDKLWLSEVPDALNIWVNDTRSTTGTGDDINLVNDAGVTHYSLNGQNITIECDTTAISYMRESKVKLVNSFLWASHPDGSWGVSLTFYDNGTTDYRNNVFFVGAGEVNNIVVPIDIMKATVYDQTNGMSLHNGKEFTVTGGGFWMAVSTMSSGDSRTFIFRYFEHKETIATQLILSPYMCDTSSPYSDKPIRCIVNHDQPSDEDFEGTVIFDLSEVSMYGTINWNRVLMRTQTDNQLYSKGTDWYVSGDYQITMPNKDIESGESITWEIFIGTVERSPDAAIDSYAEWGWVVVFVFLIFSGIYLSRGLDEDTRKRSGRELRIKAFQISGLFFMIAMLLLGVWWFARFG